MGTRLTPAATGTLRTPVTAQRAKGFRQGILQRFCQQQQAPGDLLAFHGQSQGRQRPPQKGQRRQSPAISRQDASAPRRLGGGRMSLGS